MKKFLHRLTKFFAYLGATIVILLAIAVGLFRLLLPRVPEYQDEIKDWASAAVGMQVEFSGMDARWGLSGPELRFYDAELTRPDTGVRIVAAQEVGMGVGLMRLLFEQALVVDRLVIRNTAIDIRRQQDGSLRVQDIPVAEILDSFSSQPAEPVSIEIIGEDIEFRFMQPGDVRPSFFNVPSISVSVDANRIAADADIRLPEELGQKFTLSATQFLNVPIEERIWDVRVDAESVSLRGWSSLARGGRQFESGVGDMELALAVSNGRIRTLAAYLDFIDMALPGGEFFDASGRVEVDVAADSWLLAANEFVLSTAGREWPETSLRLEAGVDNDNKIEMLDMTASYLVLDDFSLFTPWLAPEVQEIMDEYRPSGTVRNLVATFAELDADLPRFSVSASLDSVGVAASQNYPGIRGFSGLLRANRAGGRLEISSDDLEINAPDVLSRVIDIDDAEGTVIWRNSDSRTTILSDRIVVANEFFESQSNVELLIPKDGSAPEIDLDSNWRISDVAAAKLYIPERGLKPKLYEWFQMALVAGSVENARTSLKGPLDKIPFDNDEGELIIEASVRNMTFKYHPQWPASEQADMEVILDKARLYTVQNRSNSVGISVVDAKIDIPDVRDPVLHVESFSTATLQAIRDFSMQSPISRAFGGQLDRVAVSGDASFTLDLKVPLKRERLQEFEFVSRIRSNNGTLAVEGFDPPITDLIGEVTVERENISSEGLGGRFLGEAVDISLQRSEDPDYQVVATTTGRLTAAALTEELGVPLAGRVNGATDYQTRILFPNARAESPQPLTIELKTDFSGMEFLLPEPIGKTAETSLQVSGNIRFLPDGGGITSVGFAENRIAWELDFVPTVIDTFLPPVWDLDRGMVALGGHTMEVAETRGLHIRGATDVVRFQDWLALSRSGEKEVGAAERIRSIDVLIGDFYIVGQHLKAHRLKVDRSAEDWLVQLEGDDVNGSVFVPYDFAGDRPMVLDMTRLRLPGDDSDAEATATLDPRELPPIQLSAAEFAFGDRFLGAVEASIDKTADGLVANEITALDPSFSIAATGRWTIDANDPLGSRTFITASLTSTDVEQTMTRLNYTPGIVGDEMSIGIDLNWSGGPRGDFFDVLDGDVSVRFGAGQLEEVEPGAGRMFGLMSIVALPRRLSLDFRDVFSKGFGFDEITGTFRIDAGVAYTCDLSLEGPAAAIGIVGAANIATREYDQTAVVSANFGNTLPIVGGLVAGPQVAAALLIFSQIFKKPLQEVGQIYYAIDGSWDDPGVEASDSAGFVASGEEANCLNVDDEEN